MKKYDNSDIALFHLNKRNLFKRASHFASEAQTSVLVLSRELIKPPYSDNYKVSYFLYFKSPYDEHFTKLNQFSTLELFCLWYLSKHPYKEFELLNYSQV